MGGGRLLVNMDVNWAEPSSDADSVRIAAMTAMTAYFLSGATSRPAKTGEPTIVTAPQRAAVGADPTVAR